MFLPHPTKPNLWKFYGRTDDILVLENGGKVNPVPMEAVIQGHKDVSGVLVTGERRWPPCVIVEMRDNVADGEEFRAKVWELVEKANELVQEWARILPEMVVILEPGSLVRTPKGTVNRRRTVEALEKTIEGLYKDLENGQNGHAS
jgi:acyl-CoA synthetase (AMP-forming)/AMP-acid ligase II